MGDEKKQESTKQPKFKVGDTVFHHSDRGKVEYVNTAVEPPIYHVKLDNGQLTFITEDVLF